MSSNSKYPARRKSLFKDYSHSATECKQLFDKEVARIQENYKFSTALDPSSIPPPSARWKVIGKNTDVAAPIVTESIIKEYQRAKYAGGKGQYRKSYRLFSSRE